MTVMVWQDSLLYSELYVHQKLELKALLPDCRYAQGQETPAVHQLLDEVLSTALERALEPQLLEGLVLEQIMNNKQPAA